MSERRLSDNVNIQDPDRTSTYHSLSSECLESGSEVIMDTDFSYSEEPSPVHNDFSLYQEEVVMANGDRVVGNTPTNRTPSSRRLSKQESNERTPLKKGKRNSFLYLSEQEELEEGIEFYGEDGFTSENQGTGSTLGTIFNMTNSALGAGILAFPYAFSKAGIIGAILVMTFVFIFAIFTNIALVVFAHNYCSTCKSYQELMRKAFGKTAERIAILCSFLFCFGACVAYMVVIGDNMVPVIQHFTQDDSNSTVLNTTDTDTDAMVMAMGEDMSSTWISVLREMFGSVEDGVVDGMEYFATSDLADSDTDEEEGGLIRLAVIVGLSVFCIFPLCLLKNISALSFSSFFATCSVIYLLITIVYLSLVGTEDEDDEPTSSLIDDPKDVWENVELFCIGVQFLQAVPLICFAYQVHLTTPPLYSDLKVHTPKEMNKCLLTALTLVTIIYFGAGLFGYLTFGNQVESDILVSYSTNSMLMLVGHICITFVAVCSYPVLNFVARMALIDLVVIVGKKYKKKISKESTKLFYSITITYFTISLGFAILIPDINVVLGLIGGSVAVFVMFILPGALIVRMGQDSIRYKENMQMRLKGVGYMTIVAGGIVLVLSVGISLYNDISHVLSASPPAGC